MLEAPTVSGKGAHKGDAFARVNGKSDREAA